MENMRYYEKGRSVPNDALKSFSNGRFSGTDINPMWRIKKLTEMFGPAGIGWYTEILRQDVVPVDDGNLMVFVDINLYVREGDEWSKPIFGTGGNTLKTKGRGDDDGFKKAYTDALSISCKALGIGADVWYANDTTSKYADKYTDAPTSSAEMMQRGSVEAAQEAGQRKLKELEQQMRNARSVSDGQKRPVQPSKVADDKSIDQAAKSAQNGAQAVTAPMATPEQIEYIKTHSSDADYEALMAKYGAELESITVAMADKAIKRIDEKNASGLTRCERCDTPITGVVGPDGKRHTASEVIAMGQKQFGGTYCYRCATELAKKRKAG